MGTIRRARAVLKIPRKNSAKVKAKARAMNKGIGDHPALFVTPNPALAAIMNQVAVVDAADVLVGTRAKGAAKARNVQLGVLVGMLEAETLYVQSVADTSSTPEQAAATIEASALSVGLVTQYAKPILGIRQGPTSGSVLLEANAGILTNRSHKKSFFNWQYTTDGGKTWIMLPSTPRANTSLAGLLALTTYGFRVSITDTKGVIGEWSQVLPTHLVEHLPAVELRAVA